MDQSWTLGCSPLRKNMSLHRVSIFVNAGIQPMQCGGGTKIEPHILDEGGWYRNASKSLIS